MSVDERVDTEVHSDEEKSSLKNLNLCDSQNLNAKGRDSNSSCNQDLIDATDFIRENLSRVTSIGSDLPETNDSIKTIDEINSQAITSLISILEKNESERLKQQKPLRNCLLSFVGAQLLFFNGIIFYMMIHLGNKVGVQSSELLDFLKLYMGGALAELIAMVFFITRSTFALTAQSIVKGLMGRLPK